MNEDRAGAVELVWLSVQKARAHRALWLWGAALVALGSLGSAYDRRVGSAGTGPWFERLARLLQAWTVRTSLAEALVLFAQLWLLVALTRAALSALQGRPAGLAEALAPLRARWRSVLGFAAVVAAGSFLLDRACHASLTAFLEVERARLAAHAGLPHPEASLFWAFAGPGALSFLWTFTLYLGIPVLAREQASGLGAVRRAWALTRKTWGIRLRGLVVIGLGTGAALVAIAIATGLLLGLAGLLPALAPALPTWNSAMAWLMLPALTFSLVVDQLFDAALYTNVTEGVWPDLPAGQVAGGWRTSAPRE